MHSCSFKIEMRKGRKLLRDKIESFKRLGEDVQHLSSMRVCYLLRRHVCLFWLPSGNSPKTKNKSSGVDEHYTVQFRVHLIL